MKQAVAELHETKFKQLIADANTNSKAYDGEMYTLKEHDRWELYKRSHTIGNSHRDELELGFKTPHKGITQNQKKNMPRETEKHTLVHLTIGGKQTGGPSLAERDQKNLKEV